MKIAVSTYQTLWWFSNSNIGVPPECFHASSWNSIPWFWKCNCHWRFESAEGRTGGDWIWNQNLMLKHHGDWSWRCISMTVLRKTWHQLTSWTSHSCTVAAAAEGKKLWQTSCKLMQPWKTHHANTCMFLNLCHENLKCLSICMGLALKLSL